MNNLDKIEEKKISIYREYVKYVEGLSMRFFGEDWEALASDLWKDFFLYWKDEGSVCRAYFYQIIKRKAGKYWRAKYKRRDNYKKFAQAFLNNGSSHSTHSSHEAKDIVKLLFKQLKRHEVELLKMSLYYGYSNIEIAELKNCTANAVNVTIFRIKAKCKQILNVEIPK